MQDTKAINETMPSREGNPFKLDQLDAYMRWRDAKLSDYPDSIEQLKVEIENPAALTQAELKALEHCLGTTNIAIYKSKGAPATKNNIRELGRQLGLEHLDSNLCADEDDITSLQYQETGRHRGYIPYSKKGLSWHTDGYYNPPERTVRAIIMHCVQPAAQGGENMLLDPEILYIQLRDRNPDWIAALMRSDAMTIPPNAEGGEEIRGETRGPVFSVDNQGYLHMRYSARKKNIEWLENEHIKQAVDFITEFLDSESPYIYRYRLQENEGVISNNVMHNRTSFEDSDEQKRLLFRARFYDRVKFL
jgi:alpha-ketoglutarate-dependent taurine dioxygenase